MKFKLGDRVRFLNDTGEGKIVSVLSECLFVVMDEHGFSKKCKKEELVVGSSTEAYSATFALMKPKPEVQKKKSFSKQKEKYRIIDLHIEALVDNHSRMANGEILELQMKQFKKFMQKAIHDKIPKIIAIHGVGKGVLRAEIHYYLNQFSYPYHDADYQKHGGGGTEILLFSR